MDPSSIRFEEGLSSSSGAFSPTVHARLSPSSSRPGLNLMIQIHVNDAFRVRITEDRERWQPNDLIQQVPLVAYDRLLPGDARLPEGVRHLSDQSFLALTSKVPSFSRVLHELFFIHLA